MPEYRRSAVGIRRPPIIVAPKKNMRNWDAKTPPARAHVLVTPSCADITLERHRRARSPPTARPSLRCPPPNRALGPVWAFRRHTTAPLRDPSQGPDMGSRYRAGSRGGRAMVSLVLCVCREEFGVQWMHMPGNALGSLPETVHPL